MSSPTSTGTAADADRALKAKHRAMWASGDYPGLAADLLPELGETLVQAVGVTRGDRVLDIAAGSGNVAIPAARTGASVVASDLTPELFDAGRARAAAEGVELEWREADAEALPFADGEFDVVVSAIGVMFAPHHQAAADELVRVCKPGGRIGIISWTPEGFIGQLFATMKPYAPPPPPGASPPPKWGSEEHVRELLRDRVTDVTAERRLLRVDMFDRLEEPRDYFKAKYGPMIAVFRSLADDPDRAAALDADLLDLVRRHDQGSGSTVLDWEYLLLTATKRRETVPGPR
ncbi:class I SAM-dependent methyltransferase [Blastococcus haudaquaticus]|uniref:Methyltransferase domain-containing protein n=1 Tax=Blastococcus haudaquaticus TaxID=1938745 RepID=A0A286GSW2_9ACTN|nr:methyltransferase domain-containing protein [Blastococcus haudaquaticus]SOD98286.1 Methyltransferase domain-containing protein [Blastococcus haudaquaticus]